MHKIYKIKVALLCSAFALLTLQLKAQKKAKQPVTTFNTQLVDSLK